jgi:hypothetical protein
MMSEEPDADSEPGSKPGSESGSGSHTDADLPEEVIEAAERLTRLAREAVDPGERDAYRERRAAVVGEHDYTARVREEDVREVLVLHPAEWLDDGLVRTDRIDDLDRAIERPLSGPADPEDWDVVDAHNRAVAARVANVHGPTHGANARAFAEFMSNHYARRIESAGSEEIEAFLTEYFPRNAWPTAEQKRVIDESIELILDAATDTEDTSDASDATDVAGAADVDDVD